MLKPAQHVIGGAPFNLAGAHIDGVAALLGFARYLEFFAFIETQIAGVTVDILRIRRNQSLAREISCSLAGP